LLGTAAIAICDASGVLAWDGVGGAYESNHRVDAKAIAAMTLRSGRTAVLGAHDVACGDPQCPVRTAVVAPIVTEDRVVAVLVAYSPRSSAALVRATEEVARWVSGQVELAELNKERTRAMEAELRALRAQISPHFIYNALAACGPIPSGRASYCWSSPTSPGTRCAAAGSSPRCPTSCATSSGTSSWSRRGSASG
jgi:two-component system LytT family sensor kinase